MPVWFNKPGWCVRVELCCDKAVRWEDGKGGRNSNQEGPLEVGVWKGFGDMFAAVTMDLSKGGLGGAPLLQVYENRDRLTTKSEDWSISSSECLKRLNAFYGMAISVRVEFQ